MNLCMLASLYLPTYFIPCRVHQTLLSGRNCNLIGSQANTEKYYWNFLLLVLRTEDLGKQIYHVKANNIDGSFYYIKV